MDNLTHYLYTFLKAKVLDLVCGKGRHSTESIRFDVLGADPEKIVLLK
jgi:hypothetical protein